MSSGPTDLVSEPPDVSPVRRLEFLDALRGLAAIYVLVYHMLLLPQPNLVAPHWAAKIALAGGAGVTLFFIVSAFSLYYTMSLRLRDPNPTLSFYLHRFFRIAPLFYFMIAISMFRDYLEFDVRHSLVDILASVTFTFNLIPNGQEGFVWAGWTIGVEMVFYAIFPIIYHRVKTVGDAVAFLFVCFLGWLAIQNALDYLVMPDPWRKSILAWSSFRHFPIFVVGVIVYHCYMLLDSCKVHSGGYRSFGSAFLWAGIFGFAALLQGWLPNMLGDAYYWQGIVFGLVVIGLALSPCRLIVNRASCYLGRTSYSIYLTHTTAIYFLAPVYHWIYWKVGSVNIGFLASLAVTLAVVLPISEVTYRLIENPGISFGRKISSRLRRSWKDTPVGAT